MGQARFVTASLVTASLWGCAFPKEAERPLEYRVVRKHALRFCGLEASGDEPFMGAVHRFRAGFFDDARAARLNPHINRTLVEALWDEFADPRPPEDYEADWRARRILPEKLLRWRIACILLLGEASSRLGIEPTEIRRLAERGSPDAIRVAACAGLYLAEASGDRRSPDARIRTLIESALSILAIQEDIAVLGPGRAVGRWILLELLGDSIPPDVAASEDPQVWGVWWKSHLAERSASGVFPIGGR